MGGFRKVRVTSGGGYSVQVRPWDLIGRRLEGAQPERRDSVAEMQDVSNHDATDAAAERLKVLLVEDSGPVTERIATLIGELDAIEIVGAVTTERAATEALAHTPVDALVLDLHLRQGDGFGVLRFIRRQALNVAAIVFTSYDIPQYRRGAATRGAGEVLDNSRDKDNRGGALRRVAHMAAPPPPPPPPRTATVARVLQGVRRPPDRRAASLGAASIDRVLPCTNAANQPIWKK